MQNTPASRLLYVIISNQYVIYTIILNPWFDYMGINPIFLNNIITPVDREANHRYALQCHDAETIIPPEHGRPSMSSHYFPVPAEQRVRQAPVDYLCKSSFCRHHIYIGHLYFIDVINQEK